jgi:hypothetical protein
MSGLTSLGRLGEHTADIRAALAAAIAQIELLAQLAHRARPVVDGG